MHMKKILVIALVAIVALAIVFRVSALRDVVVGKTA